MLTHTSLAALHDLTPSSHWVPSKELECRYDITLKYSIQHLHLKIETSTKTQTWQVNPNHLHYLLWNQPKPNIHQYLFISQFSLLAPSMPPCLSKLSKQRVKRYSWFAGKCLGWTERKSGILWRPGVSSDWHFRTWSSSVFAVVLFWDLSETTRLPMERKHVEKVRIRDATVSNMFHSSPTYRNNPLFG